ncbi:hypothetical protein ACMXYO_00025 [Neptuniibacter sp. QD37_6]|uniref:hypothetical protein n=1 Tax=Neptuniibacter sp. QD37_6 TaxID=3398210 RepID=UPI0039F602B2
MLSPMVVELLDLSFNPITFEYSDSNGEKAVKYIQKKAKAISNYHELIYLRKDLVEQLESLSNHKLVKKLHGERRFDNVDYSRSDSDKLVRYVTFDNFLK